MALKRNLKNKVMRRAARSAGAAKQQLDQVLLKMEHSAVKKFSEKIRTAEAADIIEKLTQKILEQAQAIRSSLDPALIKPLAQNPRRTLQKLAQKGKKQLARRIPSRKKAAAPKKSKVAPKARRKKS
jgi:hypothetical protein